MGPTMADLHIDLKDQDPTVLAAYLRAQALAYDLPRWNRRGFWIGVAVGACLMAAMDIGDVHLCAGQCDGVGALRWTEVAR